MNLHPATSPLYYHAMAALPSLPGVYVIECLGNDKLYIGSGVNMQKREREHLNALHKGVHYNIKLQRAFNKYGAKRFEFSVLDFIEIKALRTVEKYWINALDSIKRGFNISIDTVAPMMSRKHTKEACAKMSAARKGKLNIMFGKKHSEETRAKLRARWTPERKAAQAVKTRLSNLGKKASLATRALMTKIRLGKPIHSIEERLRRSIAMTGAGNPMWKGGVSCA